MTSLYDAEKALPDGFRAYDARQIDDMRERLASTGAALSAARADAVKMRAAIDKVREIQIREQAAQNYTLSDEIRDALQGLGH